MSRIKHYSIGRDATNQYVISDPSVSRFHAELFVSADSEYLLVDCASTSGTYVTDDGQWRPIRQEIVASSQQIKFGRTVTSVATTLRCCIEGSNRSNYLHEDLGHRKSDPLPEGPVHRNISTGEVLEKD